MASGFLAASRLVRVVLSSFGVQFIQKPSVLKTGFWGTEGIFGTGNALLRYATHFQRRETADSDTRPLNLSN